MKRWKFFTIALVVFAALSMGLTGCEWDSSDPNPNEGKLTIRNDTFAIPDTIITVIIRQGSTSGKIIVEETVSIAHGQNRSYSLASGTYAVNIKTDLLFDENTTVSISRGSTTTLIYDDSGLR